jgi:hypothetical protein
MTYNAPAVYDVTATLQKAIRRIAKFKSLECGVAQAAYGAA